MAKSVAPLPPSTSASSNPSATLSPFLRLPSEIRLDIYSRLLCNRISRTLQIWTLPSASYHHRHRPSSIQKRTTYIYISDRLRSRSEETTYIRLIDWQRPHEPQTLHPAILLANRQIYAEAAHVLYSSHTFSFGLDIESIVPFLSDLTPTARGSIRSIALTKRALPYTKDFDRSEWAAATSYLARNLSGSLHSLHLCIMGGTPAAPRFAGPGHVRPIALSSTTTTTTTTIIDGDDGSLVVEEAEGEEVEYEHDERDYDNDGNEPEEDDENEEVDVYDSLKPFSKAEFIMMAREQEMEWARQLGKIKGLRELKVEAQMEHCPTPSSGAMVFYVAFSRSINGAFKDWLGGLMFEGKRGKRVVSRRGPMD